jgi:hypothetical protein
MAITISVLTTPTALEPINAPMWFRINSASSGLTDFKYVFRPQYKVEPLNNNFNTLGTYRIPPKPVSGDGLFSANRVLKSFIQNNTYPYIQSWTPSSAALLQYNIRYGFELNPNKIFTDTINVAGNMGITFSSTHDFEVGDILTLNKDNKNYNPQYDGTCSVVSVVNTLSIKTDKTFSTTLLAGESGYVTDQFRLSGTSSNCLTWNGTRQYDERTTDFSIYTLGDSTKKFLTDYNTTYKPIRLDDYETLSFVLSSTASVNMIVETYNSSNTIINTYTTAITSPTYRRLDVGVGPMNLVNSGIPFWGASGSAASEVDNYSVSIKSTGGSSLSETRKYKIDKTCTNYTKQRLVFLNRVGGWDYFNFTLDSKRSLSISRTEYEKILDWNYNIGDRGKSLLAQKAEVKMTLNSNWITESDSIWLEELLTSPEVFLMPTTNVVYEAPGAIYLTQMNDTWSYSLPQGTGTYNIQFDVVRADDLLIQDLSYNTLDTLVAAYSGTTPASTHYSKTLTLPSGLIRLYNILNYPADMVITNLVITKTTGDKLPIIITDTSYDVKTYLRNQMFNLVLNYKLAYDINLQNE